MPTKKQLTSFFVITETGSFYKAAEKLYISSSALIQQMNLMENELGFKLFRRSYTGIKLTPAGYNYYIEMEKLISEEDSIRERCLEIAKKEEQSISIGFCYDYDTTVLYKMINSLKTSNFSLDLHTKKIDIYKAKNEILSGQLSCCIMPNGKFLRESKLAYEIIKTVPVQLYFPTAIERLINLKSVDIRDLAGLKLLLPRCGVFDSSDTLLKYVEDYNVEIEIIFDDNNTDTDIACFQMDACRISFEDANNYLPLKHLPFTQDIHYDFTIAFNKNNKDLIMPLLNDFRN